SWMKDLEGTPRAAGELLIRPIDLAKIGQLMLDRGVWKGERIVPEGWIDRSVDAGQPYEADCGLLWWREGAFAKTLSERVVQAWRDEGIASASLTGARALLGKRFPTRDSYSEALKNAVGAATFARINDVIHRGDHIPFGATVGDGPVWGFSAR